MFMTYSHSSRSWQTNQMHTGTSVSIVVFTEYLKSAVYLKGVEKNHCETIVFLHSKWRCKMQRKILFSTWLCRLRCRNLLTHFAGFSCHLNVCISFVFKITISADGRHVLTVHRTGSSFDFWLHCTLYVWLKTAGCHCCSVPAEITTEQSCADVTAAEGDDVTLECHVTGSPAPSVLWYRKSMLVGEGSRLRVDNVSRYEADSYQCVADNGVSQPATCRAALTVECKTTSAVAPQGLYSFN